MLGTAPCERDRLIEQNLDYARRLAARMARRLPRSVDVEELESDAFLGLMRAAAGFDPGRGVAFTTYASTRINGAMLDGLRERAHVPRGQPRFRMVAYTGGAMRIGGYP
jgi:RNA polymerase sigma factor FliA